MYVCANVNVCIEVFVRFKRKQDTRTVRIFGLIDVCILLWERVVCYCQLYFCIQVRILHETCFVLCL